MASPGKYSMFNIDNGIAYGECSLTLFTVKESIPMYIYFKKELVELNQRTLFITNAF